MTKILRLLSLFCVFVFASNAAYSAGYTCDSIKQYTSCNAGYYMTKNGSRTNYTQVGNACTVCPAGYYCTAGTGDKTACPADTYRSSTGGTASTSCTSCGTGKTTNGKTAQTSSSACVSSTVTITYNLNNGTGTTPTATTCTSGSSCTLTSLSATTFYRGGYKLVGWSTSSSATSATYTTSGTFSANTTLYAVWSACGCGYYHPAATGTAANSCTKVSNAYYTTSSTATGQTAIPNGKYVTTGSCTVNSCSSLFNGNYPDSRGSRNSSAWCCVTTTAGKYIAEEGGAQVTCPANSYCPGGVVVDSDGTDMDESISSCPSGYKSSAGVSSINSCYLYVYGGSVRRGASGTDTDPCSPGYYKTAHNAYYGTSYSCNAASKGYKVASAGSSSQTACTSGTYQDTTGQSSCKNCSALTGVSPSGGTYSSASASTANTACKYTAPTKTITGCASVISNTVTYSGSSWPASTYTVTASTGYHTSNSGTSSATCAANTCTVSINTNSPTGGAPSATSVSCTYGTNCTMPTRNTLYKSTGVFTGWNTNSTGTGTTYGAGSAYSTLCTTNGATITLYAKWTTPTCTAGTGVNSTSFSSVNSSNQPLCARTCSANYYGTSPFTGSANATSVTVTCSSCPNNSRTKSGNSLSACTCTTGYSVGGTPSGSKTTTSTECSLIDTTITLSANGGTVGTSSTLYTRYNTGVYTNSTRTTAMSTSANGITKPTRSYTVSYNANSGSVSTTTTNTASTYTYNGHYSATSGGTQYIASNGYITSDGLTAGKALTEATTWYAQWTGGSVTLPTPTRANYVFNGWYTASSGGTRVGAAGASYTPTANITLYAQWTAASCVKGTGVSATSVNSVNSSNQVVCNVTCTSGYHNSGATTQTGTAGTASVTATCSACTAATNGSHSTVVLSTNSSNSCVYTGTCATGYSTSGGTNTGTTCSGNGCSCSAKCNAITLNKAANGGAAGTITLYAKSDETTLYTNNTCTTAATSSSVTAGSKTNATFGGYYNTTAASGGTQCVTTGGTALASDCTVKAATTFNAQYDCTANYRGSGTRIAGTCTGNAYTITYAAGTGGSGTNQTQSVTYGSSFTTKASNTFTKTNATFASWSASSGSYPNANTSYTYSTTSNITLTATWNCNAGYTLNSSTGACVACAKGTYKTSAGNGACTAASGRTQYTDTEAATAVKTVSSGYYTTGCNSSNNNCTGQSQCTGTTYCESGVQKDCPDANTYKRTTFPANYYNPVFSSTSIQSANGRSAITQCTALSWYNPGDRAGLYEYVTYNSSTGKYDTTTGWQYMSAKAGYYLTSKGSCGAYAYYTEVKECPAGSYCPGKSQVACNTSNQATVHTTNFGLESCPTAYSSSAAKSSKIGQCYLTLTTGKQVASAGAGATNCTAGKYCNSTANIYYNTDGGTAVYTGTDCADGTYSSAGASSCSACSALSGASPTGGTYSSVSPRNATTTCRYKAPAKTITGCASVTSNLMSYSGSAWPASTYAVSASGGYVISGNNTASATCSKCDAGTYSAGGSATSCTVCATNTWSAAGASSCTACTTANGYGNSGTSASNHANKSSCTVSCAAGKQVASAGAACTTPTGSWYTSAHTVSEGSTSGTNIKSCNSGYATSSTTTQTDHDASTDCKITCNAGTRVASAGATCTTPSGNWYTSSQHTVSQGSTSGTNCNSGYTISGTATTDHDNANDCKISCNAGYYIASAGGTCAACPAGKYCNGGSTNQTAALAATGNCPAGTYSTGGATSSACTAALSGYTAAVCANWSYSTGGASSCTACPSFTEAWIKADSTGTGWTSHTSCAVLSKDVPTGCTQGQVKWTAGLSNNSPGWSNHTESINVAYKAKAGYYVNGTTCSTCAAGTYQGTTGSTATSCTACQTGSYQDGTGQSSCKPCAAGKTNTGTGNTAACTAACTSITGLSTWATTSWSNGTVSNLCTVSTCAANYYKSGNTCPTCSSGTNSKYTLSVAGTTSVNSCYLTTTAGNYVATAQAGQVGCPANSYCAGGTTIYYGTGTQTGGSTTCTSATSSKYTKSAAGSSKIGQCYLTLTSGKQVASAGAGISDCSAGKYCTSTENIYYNTDGGTATYTGGTCVAGSYSGAGASSCTACGAGKTSTAGATAASACTSCTAITNLSTWATPTWNTNNTMSNLCTVGNCAANSYKSGNTCPTCSSGTNSKYTLSAAGTTSVNSCYLTLKAGQQVASAGAGVSNCAAGKYCTSTANIYYGTGTTTYTGTTCVAGSYSAAGASECTSCGGGKTSTAGATAASSCTACSGSGVYAWTASTWNSSNNTMSNLCTVSTCSSSYYKNGNACSACSGLGSGFYPNSANGNNSGTNACKTNNLTGQYVASANATSATNCGGGKYKAAHQVAYGSTSSCDTASAGYFAAGPTSGSQTQCVAGSYSAAGASACTACGAGKTSTAGATSANSCTACTSITNLSTWATTTWNTNNTMSNLCTVGNCAANSYKSGNTCPTCSSGTNSKYTLSAAGTTSVNSCYLTLTAGKQVASAGAGATNCTAGKYCTSTANIYYGTGTTTYTGTTCVAGSYSAAGASECTACGDGGNWGLTTTGPGQSSCNKECPHIDSEGENAVKGWASAKWNSNNTVTDLCVPNSCLTGHYLEDGSCPRCDSFANGLYPYSAASGTTGGKEACFVRANDIKGAYIATVEAEEVTLCPTGMYNDGSNSNAIHYGETSKCTTCPANTYADSEGSVQCTACLQNYTSYGPKTSKDSCVIRCTAGTYLAKANDTECTPVGAGYWAAATPQTEPISQGSTSTRNACPAGLTTIGYGVGADEAADCGRILNVGNDKIYLRSVKKTTPSLNVKIGDTTYYGNMTSGAIDGYLIIKDGNVTYRVHDDNSEFVPGGSGAESGIKIDATLQATTTVPTSYNVAAGETTWSATLSDGTEVSGNAGCSASIGASLGAAGTTGFEPEGDGTGCWCQITSPKTGNNWVYATSNTACSDKCGYYCANNMKGVAAKNITYRTNLYNTAGILKQ